MKIFKEFKEFALCGNVVDMAVAFIIGAAFGNIVKSLVDDVMMPPLGVVMTGIDFGEMKAELKKAETAVGDNGKEVEKKPAVYLSYGKFINACIHFVIVAFCVFLLVNGINTLRRAIEGEEEPPAPTQKNCPRCCSSVNVKATRCPHCTSELAPGPVT